MNINKVHALPCVYKNASHTHAYIMYKGLIHMYLALHMFVCPTPPGTTAVAMYPYMEKLYNSTSLKN